MSTRPKFSNIAFGILANRTGANTPVGRAVSDLAAALYGFRSLPPAPQQGKMGVLLFPPFTPENNLKYYRPTDDSRTEGVDESVFLPQETWLVGKRKPLVNMGPNRVGIKNQKLIFDATASQRDNDATVTKATWTFYTRNWRNPADTSSGKTTKSGTRVSHTYAQSGLYQVECKIGNTVGKRWVRILNAWGDTDLNVVGLQGMTGNLDSGWTLGLTVKNQYTQFERNQGVMLYIYDSTDTSWRKSFQKTMRALARRYQSTNDLPPDPIYQTIYTGWGKEGEGYNVAVTVPEDDMRLLEGCWPKVDKYLDDYISAQMRYGVPANIGRAISCVSTEGNARHPMRMSDNGLPAQQIKEGMLELAEYYRKCGTWKKAIGYWFNQTCVAPTPGSGKPGARVIKKWEELDEMGGVGSLVTANGTAPEVMQDPPEVGEMFFFGYLKDGSIQEDANTHTMNFSLVNTSNMLDRIIQRMEAYFETSDFITAGGTFMDGPPMRTANCIHHVLTEHTNFPEYHDVILDWSGPRFWTTSSQEGTTWNAIKAWANNDFSHVYADRTGALRFEPRPTHRGKDWYVEATREAIRIDKEHVMSFQVNDRRIGTRFSWAKLCGTSRGGICTICAEYPCGGPPKDTGNWVFQQGLQYDDYRVLCRYAAYEYSYQNRYFDIQFESAWRHDLELNDIVFFPFDDPGGRFKWNQTRPAMFYITSISHTYNVDSQSWMTNISVEQLTYGIPCNCPNDSCPRTSNDGICKGDIGCDFQLFQKNWRTEEIDKTIGKEVTVTKVPADGRKVEYKKDGSTVTTIVPGQRSEIKIKNADGLERKDGKDALEIFNLKGEWTKTNWKIQVPNRSVRQVNQQKVSFDVPYFEMKLIGPNNGSMTMRLKLTARERANAHFTVFYVTELDRVTSTAGNSNPGFKYPLQKILSGLPEGVRFEPKFMDDKNSIFGICTIEQKGYKLRLVNGGEFKHQITIDFNVPTNTTEQVYAIAAMINTNYDSTFKSTVSPKAGTTNVNTAGVQTTETYVVDDDDIIETYEVCDCESLTIQDLPPDIQDLINSQTHIAPDGLVKPGISTSQWKVLRDELCPIYGPKTCLNTRTVVPKVSILENQSVEPAAVNRRKITKTVLKKAASTSLRVALSCQNCVNPNKGQGENGEGTGPTYSCPNWPTEAAIKQELQNAANAEGCGTPLTGTEKKFIEFGSKYGINPGFVVALSWRECVLGGDCSVNPTYNNFGGIKCRNESCQPPICCPGECHQITDSTGGNCWSQWPTPEAGLEGIFELLNTEGYRATGGTVAAIWDRWAPVDDKNPRYGQGGVFSITQTMAARMGINLNEDVNIYSDTAACEKTSDGTAPPAPEPGPGGDYGGYTTMFEYSLRQYSGLYISQWELTGPTHQICRCLDFSIPSNTPIYPIAPGRVEYARYDSGAYNPYKVRIWHPGIGPIVYAHLNSVDIADGVSVELNTRIGLSGSCCAGTGYGGPHLHLQLDGGLNAESNYMTLPDILTNIVGMNLSDL